MLAWKEHLLSQGLITSDIQVYLLISSIFPPKDQYSQNYSLDLGQLLEFR